VDGKCPFKKTTYQNMEAVWLELGLILADDDEMTTTVDLVSSVVGASDR
jgi:hypothetical protein